MSRAMESEVRAPEMRHRMTQEFMDFARIVDTKMMLAAAAAWSVAVLNGEKKRRDTVRSGCMMHEQVRM